ncbi:MAG: alkene reductase [Chlamydiales bacterium]|nr:alkene reductase [Chlamydiales bacterium]
MMLQPFSIHNIELRSRVVMAPMTRCAATAGQIPTQQMAIYYGDRASVGLIVAEASSISPCANAYPNAPGIYNDKQVEGWRRATQAVHAQGGKIFLQLWHAGMMGHSSFRAGDPPLSPSGIPAFCKKLPRTGAAPEKPRPMEKEDFSFVLDLFVQAALRAKEAGFDGVELHGASGYLLDSFLHHHTNRRTDRYGKDKTRFVLEVLDAVSSVIQTGIRLSPVPLPGMQNMLFDKRDMALFCDLFRELEKRELAYVHAATDEDSHPEFGKVTRFMRSHYSGPLIGGGGYTPESAKKALEKGEFDLISFGRLLLANPNLVELIEKRQKWRSFDYRMVGNPPFL